MDSVLFFVPSKPHRVFGVTGRFYLERARHSPPRIPHLLIKFPQLVNEIQLHIGAPGQEAGGSQEKNSFRVRKSTSALMSSKC